MPTYPAEVRRAERAALRKRRRRRGPAGLAALRVAELDRLFTHTYGGRQLPNDDAGRADVRIMLHHLARRSGYPVQRITDWLDARAPWFVGEERAALVAAAIENPLRWRADTLGKVLNLTSEVRTMLRIRTVGPIDSTAAERAATRRTGAIARKRDERRAAGIGPRKNGKHQNSINALEPWKAEGICRATWFRRRARARNATSNGAVYL